MGIDQLKPGLLQWYGESSFYQMKLKKNYIMMDFFSLNIIFICFFLLGIFDNYQVEGTLHERGGLEEHIWLSQEDLATLAKFSSGAIVLFQ